MIGTAPSNTVYCAASILETNCAANPPSHGVEISSAVATARMATFGSFMSSRALALPLAPGLIRLWRSSTRGLPNPVLQRSNRIQPLRDIRLDVLPQAIECGVVRALLPQLRNGCVGFLARHSTTDEIGPVRQRLERVSSLLANLEHSELRGLCTDLEHRGRRVQLLATDAAKDGVGASEVTELLPNRLQNDSPVLLLRDALERSRTKRRARKAEHVRGVDQQLD